MKVCVVLGLIAAAPGKPSSVRFASCNGELPWDFIGHGQRCVGAARWLLESLTGVKARTESAGGWADLHFSFIDDAPDLTYEDDRLIRVCYRCNIPETVELYGDEKKWLGLDDLSVLPPNDQATLKKILLTF